MKMLKVKAGALQLTMFTVVVIALLLAAFIILIHTHKRFKIQTDFVKETISNTDKGIDYVLHNNVAKDDSILIPFDEDYKTLQVYRDYWGLFEKITSTSKIKHNRFKKIALVGASQPKQNRTALYVKDNNKPLVLVGNTKIQGLSYLPKQGVRTGNISGHSYYGKELIYGASKTSRSQLPRLSNEILNQIKTIQSEIETINQDQFIDLSKYKTLENSFFNPLQVVYSNANIHLSEVSLTGHILVQSKSKISVDASSKLTDVILIAPEIEIRQGVQGTFQSFATKQITVGNNCKLDYPSALVLNEDSKDKMAIENTNKKETPFIKISEGTNVKGVVAYMGDTKNYKAQVFIDEGVSVSGEVYCTQNLELLGHVNGSVFTSGFVANQSGSSYQNHLYNAIISINKLPEEYMGLPFNNAKKGIVKWLY